MPPTPPLHPDLEALAFLLGSWAGTGTGRYPTIEPFGYREEVEYGHVGKPFLSYRQRTWDAVTGAPLHAETGYVRPGGPGRVELVIAQPSGIVEVSEGSIVGLGLRTVTTTVATTGTAKEVRRVERAVTVAGDALRYEVLMEAVGQAHQLHLQAELLRQ